MEFPRQTIPEKEKDEEWHLNCIDSALYFHRYHDNYLTQRKKDHENYLIVEGNLDPKKYEYITDMYGITSPVRFVNYPMIMPKLDLLAGELVSQPLQYYVNVINKNAIRRKNEKKIQVATETVLRPIRREIEKALGSEIPDEDVGMEVPKDVEEYQQMKFRDHIEEMVHVGLKYCIQKWDLKQVFKRGFYDMGITAKEFYRTNIKNGDPHAERVDPRSVIYDPDSDKENLKDSLYGGIDNYYTVNEVLDLKGHLLTPTQVIEIEKLARMKSNWYDEYNSVYDNYIYQDSQNVKVRVTELQWKSIQTIKYRVVPNRYVPGEFYYKKVKDTYKKKKNETVVTRNMTEVRKATKIGHEMLVDWGKREYDIRYEENYANTDLDFHGVIKNNFNGMTLSIVDSLKNISEMYDVVMYHINLAMARSGGKAMVYDVSQKPKNMPLEDVIYHAKNSGLIVINSKMEGNQLNTFNQFQNVDFTLSTSVAQLINLKMLLEDTADKLTGISAARAGVTKSGDLVGVTERNVMQSTLITAPLFDLHYKVVGDVLNGMANLMRVAWAEEDRMANIFGDMGMQTFKIDKSVALDEYGIFIENSGKDVQKKQEMFALMQNFANSGNVDPLTMIKAVNADSAVEVEKIMKTGLESVQAISNQLEERQVAAQEASNEIDAQKVQVPLEVAKLKSQTDLQIAQMKEQANSTRQGTQLEHDEDSQEIQNNADLDKIMLTDSNQGENASESAGK